MCSTLCVAAVFGCSTATLEDASIGMVPKPTTTVAWFSCSRYRSVSMFINSAPEDDYLGDLDLRGIARHGVLYSQFFGSTLNGRWRMLLLLSAASHSLRDTFSHMMSRAGDYHYKFR